MILSDFDATMKCMHCGDAVIFTGHTAQGFDTDYLHANTIRRCLPEKSGKPYGLEADVSHEPEPKEV